MDTSSQKKVFLSYAREDLVAARRVCNALEEAGLSVWFDERSLLPGQRWKVEIAKAIRESSHFLALLSSSSVSKRGFVQKELRDALDLLDQLPESDVFVIPARLDKCQPSHDKLRELQWVDLCDDWSAGIHQIVRAVSTEPELYRAFSIVDHTFDGWANLGLQIDDSAFRYLLYDVGITRLSLTVDKRFFLSLKVDWVVRGDAFLKGKYFSPPDLSWLPSNEEILPLLAHPSPHVRKEVLNRIPRSDTMVDEYRSALSERDRHVRSAAAWQLIWLAAELPTRKLELLRWVSDLADDPDESVRMAAALAIGDSADVSKVDTLLSMLKEHSTVSFNATSALGQLRDERAIRPLLEELAEASSGLYFDAQRIAVSLGMICQRHSTEPLTDAFVNNTGRLRGLLAYAMGIAGDDKCTSMIKHYLNSATDPLESSLMILALGKLGDDMFLAKAKDVITALVDDDIKLEIAKMISSNPRPELREAMIAGLTDLNQQVRGHMCIGLKAVGRQDDVEPLRRLFKDVSASVERRVCDYAIEAVETIKTRTTRS